MSETESLTELAFQAESGDAHAQYQLGVLFLSGERVEQDLDAARRWFHAAAANGNVGAEAMQKRLLQLPTASTVISRGRPFRGFVVPVLILLGLSIQSGYQYRQPTTAAQSPHSPIALPFAAAHSNPAAEASVAFAKNDSPGPESAETGTISRKSVVRGHAIVRGHR